MADIPHEALSEHVRSRLSGYQVKVAVFLTFEFEPAFFENHVLPLLVPEGALSQVPKIRRAQLDDAIAQRGLELAVYYHGRALVLGEGSACLDSRRIPLWPKAFFHSKLILIIGERQTEDGVPERHLFAGTPSANLTENGWWKNVEACHFERLGAGEKSYLAESLSEYLEDVRKLGGSNREHVALDAVRNFLRAVPRAQMKSRDGVLATQFFGGTKSFAEFLKEATRGSAQLTGMHLEIISPFVNKDSISCLDQLIQATKPASVTLAQLHTREGKCFVDEETFNAVDQHPRVRWGELISAGLGLGREAAGRRFVHAKVYRFFSSRPRREVYFVGSLNLTRAAHQNGGNHECGFLVEVERPSGRPWLSEDAKRPIAFLEEELDEREQRNDARHAGSRVELRFDWRASPPTGALRWGGSKATGEIVFRSRGQEVFRRQHLNPGVEWEELAQSESAELETLLCESSILEVLGEEPECSTYLLVQEENMSQKPSYFRTLTAAQILKYWSLLSAEQKENFLEKHLPPDIGGAEGADLAVFRDRREAVETMFDRVAGVYHAFARLEAHVSEALTEGKTHVAVYRLFGQKFDSLPRFLDDVARSSERELVDKYLIYRCALQVIRAIRDTKQGAELWNAHPEDASHLDVALQELGVCREELLRENPDLGEFLVWFDTMFDERARPMEAAE